MTVNQEPNFNFTEPLAPSSTGFSPPRRISVTVSYQLYQRLVERSDSEGRSLSKLASSLLEQWCGDTLDS